MTYLTNSNGILFFRAILDLRWSDTRTLSKKNLGCCWALTDFVSSPRFDASNFNRWCWLLHLSEKLSWPNLRLGVTQLTTWTAPWLQEPHRGPPLLTLPPVSLTAVNNSKFNPIIFSLAGVFFALRRLLSFMFWHLDSFCTGCTSMVPRNYFKLVWVFR